MIIYGSRLFGRVFPIPRVGFVATMFFHIFWIPIIPLQTWFVTGEDEDSIQGLKLPLSGWSVLAAYARAGIVVGGICGLIFGVLLASSLGSEPPALQVVGTVCDFAFALAAIPLWLVVRGLARPSAERRTALLMQLGVVDAPSRTAPPAAVSNARPAAPRPPFAPATAFGAAATPPRPTPTPTAGATTPTAGATAPVHGSGSPPPPFPWT